MSMQYFNVREPETVPLFGKVEPLVRPPDSPRYKSGGNLLRAGNFPDMRPLGFLATMLLLVAPACAWNSEGHRTVALVAEKRMPPATRAYALALLAHHPAAQVRALPDAAVWPDQVRGQPEFHHGSWHFLNTPVWLDVPERPVKVTGDIERALNGCTRTLKDPRASARDKAIALAWVVHLIGDIHQPLHAANGYSAASPDGDRGGGELEVTVGHVQTNLHTFWDSAGGLFWRGANRDRLSTIVEGLWQSYPVEQASLAVLSPHAWAQESHRLAVEEVYRGVAPGQTLSPTYVSRARDISQARLALAGYRLADYLERLQTHDDR